MSLLITILIISILYINKIKVDCFASKDDLYTKIDLCLQNSNFSKSISPLFNSRIVTISIDAEDFDKSSVVKISSLLDAEDIADVRILAHCISSTEPERHIIRLWIKSVLKAYGS